MNSTQKRIVLALVGITLLVFVAVLIASVGGSGDEPIAGDTTITTTTTSAPASSTSQTTTTTEASTTTSSPTTTSSTTTSTTTTSTTAPPPPLVLRGDGLGSVAFGEEADQVVETITALLGTPDEDSGWIPSFSGFGTCPGEQVRGLRWKTLWVLMTDGETEWRNDGTAHFFSYLNSVFYGDGQSLGLLTSDGIALGDPISSLRDTYGTRLQISFDELINGFFYNVDVPAPGLLSGGLTGDQDDDLITSIDGGSGCGE
jgi:hypothetical protein